MDNKNIKRSSTTLIIREMQVKSTMRYCFTTVGTDTMKKPELTNISEDAEKYTVSGNEKGCSFFAK